MELINVIGWVVLICVSAVGLPVAYWLAFTQAAKGAMCGCAYQGKFHVTYEYAGAIYRAMRGDRKAQSMIPLDVVDAMIPPEETDESGPMPFAAWLDRNRTKLSIIEDRA